MILSSLVLLPAAVAQQLGAMPLDSGTLIRIKVSAGYAVRGRLLEPFQLSTSPTLVFCSYQGSCISKTDPHVQAVPIAQIATLEVASGSHWLRGGLIAGGLVAVLGGGYLHLANGLCESPECRSSARRTTITVTIFAFGLGALLGAGSPRWRPAP